MMQAVICVGALLAVLAAGAVGAAPEDARVAVSGESLKESVGTWAAASQPGPEDYTVDLQPTSEPKLQGRGCLRFTFKKQGAETANRHARVQLSIPPGRLDLLSFPDFRAYWHVRVEQLPADCSPFLLIESPGANATIPLSELRRSAGSFVAIELDARRLVALSRSTPRLDPTRISRLFLGIANGKKEDAGSLLVGALTDRPLAPVLATGGAAVAAPDAGTAAITPRHEPTPSFADLKPSIPRIDVPIYLMEYHIWFSSPFGPGSRGGWTHWADNPHDNLELPMGLGGRRQHRSVGHPLIGHYDPAVEEVIRWQIRCMKAAGLDGAFVQLFPLRGDGTRFGEDETIFPKILEIAAAEGFHIGVHDEVHFRRGWTAQQPEVMAQRVAKIVKRFGSHPGYLCIDGKPAYQFQAWGLWDKAITYNDLETIFRKGQELAGRPVYFIPMIAPNERLMTMPNLGAVVVGANSNFIHSSKGKPYAVGNALDWAGLESGQIGPTRKFRPTMKARGTDYWIWGYPGFNDTTYGRANWFDRRGGRALIELLDAYRKEKPDAILLSSWNDWRENTAMEPGLAFDDYNGDPYLYCRILAATKGKEFVPPPLPKPEAVDPWLHASLYGVDRTPPLIHQVWYSPLEPALQVTAFDEHSALKGARALRYGNGMLRFTDKPEGFQAALAFPPASTLKLESAEKRPGLSLGDGGILRVEFTKAPASLAQAREAWLHLSYFDGQAGSISVGYPADPATIATFEPRPVAGSAPCLGGKGWREAWVRLRNLVPTSGALPITLRFSGRQGKPEDAGPVLLGSVSLVYDFTPGLAGVDRAVRAEATATASYQFNNLVPDGSAGDWVFVQAEDTKGNASVPVAVNLAEARDPFAMQRLK